MAFWKSSTVQFDTLPKTVLDDGSGPSQYDENWVAEAWKLTVDVECLVLGHPLPIEKSVTREQAAILEL